MSPDPDDALAAQLKALRHEYLTDSTRRVEELRRLLERLTAGERAALAELRQALHRLAGSGGSYGFPMVSSRSRDGEQLAVKLSAGDAALDPASLASLGACVEDVARAFADALAAENDA